MHILPSLKNTLNKNITYQVMHLLSIAIIPTLVLSANIAFAQSPIIPPSLDPGAIQERQIEVESFLKKKEELERQSDVNPVESHKSQASVKEIPGGDIEFKVKSINFTTSEILDARDLEKLTENYINKLITFNDLQNLASRINKIYQEKGIVTAQAVIPPQDLTDGVVLVRLIEGRVGKIELQGNASTSTKYVKGYLNQQGGDIVSLPLLENDLIRFNRTNDAQIRAELKPGRQVGETDIDLLLIEPPLHNLKFYTDNGGNKQTGEYRAGLIYANQSLFGRRDILSLSTSHAKGQESYSVSYDAPVSSEGTRLQVAYYDDKTKVVKGEFADLNLTGEAKAFVATVRHPLVISGTKLLNGVFGAKARKTVNSFEAFVIQDTKTTELNVGVDGQWRLANGYWLGGVFASHVSAKFLGSEKKETATILRGNLRRGLNLAPGYSLSGNFNWQYSKDELLPPSEQFLIGGEYSVRGYENGLLAGDKGYNINLEWSHPLFSGTLDEAPKANGFFFVDHGVVWPYRANASPLLSKKDSLWGAGWGMNMVFNKHLSLKATLGVPLKKRIEEEDSYQANFQLVWSIL